MLLSSEFFSVLKTLANPKIFNDFKHIYTCAARAAEVSFKLSDIGEGIREVTVKEWFVKVGDKVSQFDEICEVQSDKASVTITSRYDGIVKKLHYKIDDTALVGKPLVDIETDNVEEVKIVEKKETVTKIPETVVETVDDRPKSEILCIPSVRRLGKEYNIDLSKVKATGKDGRILKEDVLRYLAQTEKPSLNLTHDKTEPIKGFQKAMVKTMTASLMIPHFNYGDEIEITNLSQLRKTLKNQPEFQDTKISFMPFLIKAASNALQRFPVLNSTLDEKCENVTYKSAHNIGVAMDTNAGLAVPVIKNVDKLSILEINNELNRLIKSGRKGTFSPQDLTEGTFTISNIGAIGGTYMSPVIMPPQVAIIAFGASKICPRFDDCNNIVPVEIMNISAAADHRIVDGATMARFVQNLKKQIQNPYLLFLNLS